jgi:hypothetical protein
MTTLLFAILNFVGLCVFLMIAFDWAGLVESWRRRGGSYRAYSCRLLACLCSTFEMVMVVVRCCSNGEDLLLLFTIRWRAVGIMTMGLDSLFGMGMRMVCALILFFPFLLLLHSR